MANSVTHKSGQDIQRNPETGKSYGLQQAMRDFTLRELAEGAELVLSETIPYSKNLSAGEPKDTGDLILSLKAAPSARRILRDSTQIRFSEKYGELVDTYCGCREFDQNHYCCRHITGLLLRYYIDQNGTEYLRDPKLKESISLLTGVADPFIPGILRKTDRKLDILHPSVKEKAAAPRPLAAGSGRQTGNMRLSVEFILSEENGCIGIELKAGPKKHYVIRSIPALLKAYLSDSVFAFTKKVSVKAGRSDYDTSSRVFMDFLAKLYVQTAHLKEESITGNFQEVRELYLNGRDLDAFIELLNSDTVSFRNSLGETEMLKLRLQEEPGAVRLCKEPFGATLHIPPQRLLGIGMEWVYIREEDRILRIPQDQWELRKKLSQLSADREYYIQEKDIAPICSGLEPLLKTKGQIETEGFELAAYLPQVPDMEIYLDHPQEDLISCQVFAVYHRPDQEPDRVNIYQQTESLEGRNTAAESAAGDIISAFFTAFEEETATLFLECDERQLYVFLTEVIPVLSEQGEILVSDQMKRLKARPSGELSVGIQVEQGNLAVSLRSNQLSREELIEALSAYRRKTRYTRLKNGTFLTFTEAESAVWDAMAETFRSYGRKNPESMKVPMFRALYLDELLRDRDEVILTEGEKYKELLLRIRDTGQRRYPLPESLKGVLRPYQKDGYRWIRMLKDHGFGGILADDMGLGKTLQVLTFLLSEQEQGKDGDALRTLIVAPASLIYNWENEIHTFTPQLRCCVIAGTAAKRKEQIHRGISEADIFITSYDLLKRDIAAYEGIRFANEIIDEAQFIKNQNTQAAKGVRLLDSSFRLALTGTPIENRLSELWSIFDYLMPGFLYTYRRFRTEYEIPIVTDHEEETLNQIRHMVHPFILRRMKKEVLKDLPDKLEETVVVRLEGEQRRLYDAYAQRLKMSLSKQSEEEFHNNKIEILAELTRLRQICCGPELLFDGYRGGNAKKDACMELLHQAIDGGHKVLLFSQFTSVLDELCETIRKEGIAFHRIDGSVSKEQRMEQVQSFASDDVPVFCISLKAGGTGLNLTAADIVIHYDPWWNIAAQNQATDRTHRIGQNNTVTVYQLIADQTIEQQIVMIQRSKAKLAEDILTGEGISSILIDKDSLARLL